MDKIKKHWKIIVIVLLAIFSMNKCVSSCSNESKYKNARVENSDLLNKVDSLSNIIIIKNSEINQMNLRINDNKEIAVGNNTYWQDSVTVLNDKIKDLTNKYNKEVKEHTQTKKELKKLQENK